MSQTRRCSKGTGWRNHLLDRVEAPNPVVRTHVNGHDQCPLHFPWGKSVTSRNASRRIAVLSHRALIWQAAVCWRSLSGWTDTRSKVCSKRRCKTPTVTERPVMASWECSGFAVVSCQTALGTQCGEKLSVPSGCVLSRSLLTEGLERPVSKMALKCLWRLSGIVWSICHNDQGIYVKRDEGTRVQLSNSNGIVLHIRGREIVLLRRPIGTTTTLLLLLA
jgi:hypothetical protein